MALIKFVGDIHIGKKPSHSTKASAFRHKGKVDEALSWACKGTVDMTIQLGDLFDSYAVSNNDLSRSVRFSKYFSALLKGNHDHAHNSYNKSALEDLETLVEEGTWVTLEPEVTKMEGLVDQQDVFVHFVPYMPTQQEFLEALTKLSPLDGVVNILVLHTNMHAERFNTSETENNLTEEKAKELVTKFDLVVSGHEHNGCVKHGVHMAGSLFPHNFGDISNKYVLVYDTVSKAVTKQSVWDAETGYAFLTPEEFLSVGADHFYDFIEILGDISSPEILPLVKHASMLLSESKVSGIKNNTKVLRNNAAVPDAIKSSDWLRFVEEQLTEEQFDLFKEIHGAVK